MKKFFRSLFSIWSTDVSDSTTVNAETPVTLKVDPAVNEKLKVGIDAVFEAAKLVLRSRPIALCTIIAADAIIDALWDKIFPPAQAALTAKGVSV